MSSSDNESEHLQNPSRQPNEHISEVMKALKQNNAKDQALSIYLKAARWISMGIHPYVNLFTVFIAGLEQDDAEDGDTHNLSEVDREELGSIFTAILALTPSFEDVVAACAGHKRALRNLIRMLQDASHSARNDDVAKTNSCISDYIIEQKEYFEFYDYEDCPMPERANYRDRGWNHPQYSVLLYPMCSLDHMRSEEMVNVMHDCENAVIEISESEWPAFLYPIDTSPDVEDDLNGLFRGYLLTRVYRQIFTSPRSAMHPETAKKGRSSKARQHNLTKVTPQTIAYACVITRIALRGNGWATEDGQFEYEVFYRNIINIFEDPDNEEWAQETLEWWNEQVPGLPHSTAGGPKKKKSSTTSIQGRILDPVARAKAQREARAAAAASVTVTAHNENERPPSSAVRPHHPTSKSQQHSTAIRPASQTSQAMGPARTQEVPHRPILHPRNNENAGGDSDSDLTDLDDTVSSGSGTLQASRHGSQRSGTLASGHASQQSNRSLTLQEEEDEEALPVRKNAGKRKVPEMPEQSQSSSKKSRKKY